MLFEHRLVNAIRYTIYKFIYIFHVHKRSSILKIKARLCCGFSTNRNMFVFLYVLYTEIEEFDRIKQDRGFGSTCFVHQFYI